MTTSAVKQYPKGSILDIASTIVPNSFEEKLAKDLRVCPSTGKSVSIAYHTFGEPSNPLVLLIPGLNAQSVVNYDSATCTWLASQGLYVVRMDNRDTGLSSKFDDVPQRLSAPFLMLPNWMAFGERQPYTLDDMADDASALIKYLCAQNNTNAVDAPAAHVVGVSMGGMISQCVGLRNPELVRSLTLVMTNSGNPRVGQPSWSTLLGLLHKPKSLSVEHLNEFRRWYVDGYLAGKPLEDRVIMNLVEREYPRAIYIKGAIRQMAAIQRTPCRDEALAAKLNGSKPIHIVHGALDRLVPAANGYHLSKLLPSAKLSIFPEMGHYVDPDCVQEVMESLVAFIKASH